MIESINTTLDIISPCYNPPEGWDQEVIKNIHELTVLIPNVGITLIIVNDGSTKGLEQTQIDSIKNALPNFIYISYEKNRGKGYALRQGIINANSDYQIYIDIDFPYTLKSVVSMFSKLTTNNYDIVVAHRGESYYKNVPKARVIISKSLRTFNKLFLNMSIQDTQCGLKAFNNKGKEVFLQTTINRYLFDLEFVYLASNNADINITPIESTLKENVIFTRMNLTILKQEGWEFVKLVTRNIFSK